MSDKPKDGGPAFPVPDSHHANGQVQYGCNGMSKREWFAGMALQGWLASFGPDDGCSSSGTKAAIAKQSYEFADAMLAALEKEDQP